MKNPINLIRIDLKTKKIKYIEISQGHELEFYAGRSLSSKVVSKEVSPASDALGKENKLIFASGFLGGTLAPNSGRLSIGAKSPLTGGIKESNVGGKAPALISSQNVRGIVCENISDDWIIIKLKDGKVELLDGKKYVGMDNYKLSKELFKDFGSKIGALTIGSAGEYKFPSASIASIDLQGYPSRHAARGGLGGVMGSKKIKAVVVIQSKSLIEYNDKKEFTKVSKPWFKDLNTSKATFSKFGTAIMISGMSATHGLPTKNFRRGSFKDVDKIDGDALHEFIIKNSGKFSIACSPGCAIKCSNLVNDSDGNHITSSLEYETIGLNGSNLLINDIEKLAWIDHYADDIGLDSIELGNSLAIMMEAGKLDWGDAQGVISLLKKFKEKNSDSLDLGLGCYMLAKKLGISRVPHSKKQGFPAYDPRSYKAMGVTLSTSPMGADHTSGAAINNRKAYAEKDYGKLSEPDRKVLLSKELQIFTFILDSMGMCYFVGPSYQTIIKLSKLLKAKYGNNRDKSAEEWIEWSKKCLLMENKFNLNAGIGKNELPSFILNENLEEIERKWDVKPEKISNFWNDM